jgi:hypothetical protein
MFGRRALPFGTIVLVSIIALAVMGLGYAWWSTELTDVGVVNTATFNANWLRTFTDDGNSVDEVSFDVGDFACAADTNCIYPKTGLGSEGARDPSGPGANGPRSNKAIGSCGSVFHESGDDPNVLHWTLSNVYPGYYCTVWSDFHNESGVPMRIQSAGLSYADGITTGYIDGYAPTVGRQVDPNEVVHVGMWVRVDDDANPNKPYIGSSNITLVQWNAP